jgi:hypothetical protein
VDGLAMSLDYVLLGQLFKPEDGYDKLDVYVYYLMTLLSPVGVGRWYLQRGNEER